ncbi:MAG: amidohydrolase family protein [Bdellovibrionales bacterium]
MKTTLIRNATLVTMNRRRQVIRGDLRLERDQITEIGSNLKKRPGDAVVDAEEGFVIPGLVQAHTHLCQALFRGWADDLELLDWLSKRIWPMEKAHNRASIRASAQIGLLEMQLLGTTSILDMGTVRLHEEIFDEVLRSGMRYWGGPCFMDDRKTSGPLYRGTDDSLAYARELIQEWHQKTPLIEYAISPRFAVSCTDRLMRLCSEIQKEFGLVFHTHASENRGEVALVKRRTGLANIQYLKKVKCLNEKSVIAHAIHLSPTEIATLAKSRAGIAHCPSSNLKLASGFAPIQTYLKKGIKVGLGADGAPCNNMMDPFMEMRLAALLQKPLFGPTALPAQTAFELATLGGARVLGADNRIGSLEVGKQADVVVVRRTHPSVATVDDPYSALVYSCSGRDVRHVWIAGKMVVKEGAHRIFDRDQVIANARSEKRKLWARLPRDVRR